MKLSRAAIAGSWTLLLAVTSFLAWRTGLTWDEIEWTQVGINTVNYLRAGFPAEYRPHFFYKHDAYYGQLFNLVSVGFQALVSPCPLFSKECAWEKIPEISSARHLSVAFFGTLLVPILYLAFRRVRFSREEAFTFSFLLPSCLYFLGHVFMDSNDIPFAVALTFGSYLIGRIFMKAATTPARIDAVKIGFAIAVAANLRIAGLSLIGHLAAVMIFISWPYRARWQVRKDLVFFSIATATALIACYLSYPASWRNPLLILDILEYVRKVPDLSYSGAVFLWGKNWPSTDLSWWYVPSWFLVKTPILILFAIGAFFFIKLKERKLNSLELVFLLQLFTVPLLAIATNAILYNGIRHLIFIYPAAIFLAGVALRHLRPRMPRSIGIVLGLHFLVAIADLTLLGTHAYTYFNEPVRALGAENDFEHDYWGESTKALAKKIAQAQRRDDIPFLVVPSSFRYDPYPPPEMQIRDTFGPGMTEEVGREGFLYLSPWRPERTDPFQNCPIIHSVNVQTLGGRPYLLSYLRRCPPGSSIESAIVDNP